MSENEAHEKVISDTTSPSNDINSTELDNMEEVLDPDSITVLIKPEKSDTIESNKSNDIEHSHNNVNEEIIILKSEDSNQEAFVEKDTLTTVPDTSNGRYRKEFYKLFYNLALHCKFISYNLDYGRY